jgi:hypothetical protein
MLSNMFDPMLERDPNWDQEIRDDVIEECNKHGGVLHIYVDKASSQVPSYFPRIRIFRPGSRFQGQKGPGSGSATNNVSIFNPKIVIGTSSRKYEPEWVSWVRVFFLPGSRVKKAPDPGSATRSRIGSGGCKTNTCGSGFLA